MNHQKIKEHLRVNSNVFKYLFQSVSDGQARWKPGEGRWSILEVINHLYDEETETPSLKGTPCPVHWKEFV